jgi:hypothetical protein
MKRISLILLILISCIAVMTSCSEDPKKRFLSLVDPGTEDPQDPDNPETVFYGPSSVTATDGNYKTKVGINWATVTDAVSYKIYRSGNVAGPFTGEIASINASDLVNVDTNVVSGTTPDTVTPTATGGTCDVPVMQASYQSTRDIGSGIRLKGGIQPLAEHYTISIKIGGQSLGTIKFDGRSIWLWDSYNWTQDLIVAEFNKYLGTHGTCYPVTVNGHKYIKIVSPHTIELTNQYDLAEILWVPLNFIDSSAGWNTAIHVEPVMIACNDITAPTVLAVSPIVGAADIALNAKVSVAFSETINTATLNDSSFTLSSGGSPVAGTVSNTGVFTPTSELSPNTEYTATVTTAVTDLAGNHLSSNYAWKFTTSAAVLYYYVDTAVTEGTHYYYAITAVDKDGKESKMSPVEEGFTKANDNVPSKVASCTASDGLVGGITVSWEAATGATFYRVYRITSTGQIQMGGDITGLTYTDTTVAPGVYSYKVAPFNTFGEGGSSNPDTGFRAITDYEFFDMVYAEEESALKQSDKINNQKTGTDIIYDKNGNGNCKVVVSGSLSSASVSITFTNYCDIFLILNGTQLSSIQNPLSSANGTITGQLNATGVYSGYVKFNLGMSNAIVTSGTYTVSQNGGTTQTTIPYSYVPAD